MRKVWNLGATMAAIILITSPVAAQNKLPKNALPSASAPAQSAIRTTAVTAEDRAMARDIAAILAPRELSEKYISEYFSIPPEQFFAKSPQMRAVERRYPGITKMMLSRMQIWFDSKFDEVFEGSLNAQSNSLAQNLSNDDLRITKSFLLSPAGQSFIAIAFSNTTIDKDAISDEMGNAVRGKGFSSEAVFKTDDDAMAIAIMALPEDQQDVIFDFVLSPTGDRFLAALDPMEAARLLYVEEFMTAQNDEINTIAMAVFEDYQKGVR